MNRFLPYTLTALLVTLMAGCSTPNPNLNATTTAYDQVKPGMTRAQVYALLGEPKKCKPDGDVEHCRVARWSIPHNSRGWGSWKVKFKGDIVSGVSPLQAIASASISE